MAKDDKFSKVFDRMRDAITELEVDVFQEAAEYVRDRIVSKGRQGKQVDKSGRESKLPGLSKEYVEQRKRRRKAGDKSLDSQFFSPARANNTLTGQFMESIVIEKIDPKSGLIVIAPENSQRKGEKLTNKRLSGYLKDMGRSIFGLDQTGRKTVMNKLKSKIRDQIRKNLLRK